MIALEENNMSRVSLGRDSRYENKELHWNPRLSAEAERDLFTFVVLYLKGDTDTRNHRADSLLAQAPLPIFRGAGFIYSGEVTDNSVVTVTPFCFMATCLWKLV